MKIEFHHHRYNHCDQAIEQKLDRILQLLKFQGEKIMANVQDILTEVTRQGTVDDSILALVTQLEANAAAAGVTQVQIDQIFSQVKANNDKVAAAVVANTPAAPAA